MEELRFLASLGVGGILAGFIFWAYRADRNNSESRMVSMATDFRSIVVENTAALTKLIEYLEDREKRFDRIERDLDLLRGGGGKEPAAAPVVIK